MVEAVAQTKMCQICENRVEKTTPKGKLLRADFTCGHSLCVKCMKKYIASSVCMAIYPIKCPKDGCTGKIKSSQANFFIDKKL